MSVSRSLISRAVQQAQSSPHSRYWVGAVVFRKKNVISVGHNIPKKVVHPAELPLKFRKHPDSIHAEMSALLSARCCVKGASILVVRINRKGQLRMAFPCRFCLTYLQHVGIRRVWFSDNDQEIQQQTL